jgi:hypothetical protein
MAVVDELADDLAKDVLAAQDEMGNDRLYLEVAKVLSTLSPSMEEGFLTAIRDPRPVGRTPRARFP